MSVQAPAAAAATDPTAAAAPKKSRKLLFLALGLAVVLVGGGAGAWLLLKPSAGAHKAAAVERLQPIYVALDPPFVVNFESSGLVRFLQVTVQVMTEDPLAAELIKKHDPVVRNGLLMLFSGQTYDVISTKAGKQKLRSDALAEVRRIVVAEGGKSTDVKDLYFTSFVMQ